MPNGALAMDSLPCTKKNRFKWNFDFIMNLVN